MSTSVIWFIVGFVCMVLEMMSPLFIILFFGLGSWAASLSMYLGASFTTSLLIFSVVSVGLLLVFRRLLVKTLKGDSSTENAVQQGMHTGKKATVTQMITVNNVGEVSIGGSFWRAALDTSFLDEGKFVEKSDDSDNEIDMDANASNISNDCLEIGTIVMVTAHDPHDAILLLVRPV